MNRTDQLRQLLAARPLQCDGATGTQLQQLGLKPGESCERWVLENPDKITLVHQRYLDAGTDLLTTNTFGATTLNLAAHKLADQADLINRDAAQLARQVAADRAFVLGDMGPFGGLLEPYGETEPAAARDAFLRQAAALIEGGADALLVETQSDPAEAALALAAAREAAPGTLILCTYAFQIAAGQFRTMMGTDVVTAVKTALDAGADIVGANCGTSLGLGDYAELTRQLVAAANGAPVIVQPNAGNPVQAGDKTVYATTPDDFAAAAKNYIALGARIVGGCCGTTPAHIAASSALIKAAR